MGEWLLKFFFLYKNFLSHESLIVRPIMSTNYVSVSKGAN